MDDWSWEGLGRGVEPERMFPVSVVKFDWWLRISTTTTATVGKGY